LFQHKLPISRSLDELTDLSYKILNHDEKGRSFLFDFVYHCVESFPIVDRIV